MEENELLEKLRRIGGTPKYETQEVEGTDVSLFDADTYFHPETGPVRVRELQTPEVQHYNIDKLQNEGGDYLLGDLTTDYASKAIKEKGFTNPVLSGKRGFYGRPLGDLRNDEGEYFSDYMLQHGFSPLTKYSSDEAISVSAFGGLDRAQRRGEGKPSKEDEQNALLNHTRDVILEAAGVEGLMKPMAPTEAHYAAAPDFYSGVAIRSTDRNIMNNQTGLVIDNAWNIGKKNTYSGALTSLGLLADSVGLDKASEFFQGHSERFQREISKSANISGTNAFDKDGNWTLNGITDYTNYLGRNIALSGPQMITSIAAVIAAVPTYGASLSVPLSIYGGQNYNAQAKKDVAKAYGGAVFQTALDLVGVKGGNALVNKMFTKKGLTEATKIIAKEKAIDEKSAAKLLNNAIQTGNTQILEGAEELVKKTILKNPRILKGLATVGVESAFEGATEAAQEAIAIYAEGNEITPEERINRLLNAAVAGTFIGGTFSGIGELSSPERNFEAGLSPERANTVNRTIQERDFDNFGRYLNTDEVIGQLDTELIKADAPEDVSRGQGIAGQASHKLVSGKKPLVDRVIEFAPSLIRQQVKTAIGKYQSNGKYISYLGSLIGANEARGGLALEPAKRKRQAEIIGYEVFDENRAPTASGFRNASDMSSFIFDNIDAINSKINKANSQNKTLAEVNNGEFSEAFLPFLEQVRKSNQQLNKTTKGTANILDRSFSRRNIKWNQREFEGMLSDKLNISASEANDLTEAFLQNEDYASIPDVYDQLLNLSEETSKLNKKDTEAKLKNDSSFGKFLEPNIFNTLASNSGRQAAGETNAKYIGEGGAKWAKALDLSFANGEITADEKIEIAGQLEDYLKQLSGNYNRINSKYWNATMNGISMLSSIALLPLSAISSIVETAFVTMNGNPQPIQALGKIAPIAGKEMLATLNEWSNSLSGGIIPMKEYSHRNALRRAGYLLESQAPSARQGAEVDPRVARLFQNYFSVVGLTGITNIQRAVRLSIATDAIDSWASQAFLHSKDKNSYFGEAMEQLTRVGADPDLLMQVKTLEQQGLFDAAESIKSSPLYTSMMEGAEIRFVDTAVAMPEKGNRPKFYNDPRYRLFTQLQGYSSTATAVLLPPLFAALGGKASMPAARVKSVQTIAGLLGLAMLALALKQSIKGNEEDEELDGRDIRLILNQSGLLGTPSRAIDAIAPIYPNRTALGNNAYGVGGKALSTPINSIIKESPSLSYLDNVLGATQKTIEGDKNANREILKLTPFQAIKNRIAPYEQ